MSVTALVVVNGIVIRDRVILTLVHRVAPPSSIRRQSERLSPRLGVVKPVTRPVLEPAALSISLLGLSRVVWQSAWRASRRHGPVGRLPDCAVGDVEGQTWSGRL